MSKYVVMYLHSYMMQATQDFMRFYVGIYIFQDLPDYILYTEYINRLIFRMNFELCSSLLKHSSSNLNL